MWMTRRLFEAALGVKVFHDHPAGYTWHEKRKWFRTAFHSNGVSHSRIQRFSYGIRTIGRTRYSAARFARLFLRTWNHHHSVRRIRFGHFSLKFSAFSVSNLLDSGPARPDANVIHQFSFPQLFPAACICVLRFVSFSRLALHRIDDISIKPIILHILTW